MNLLADVHVSVNSDSDHSDQQFLASVAGSSRLVKPDLYSDCDEHYSYTTASLLPWHTYRCNSSLTYWSKVKRDSTICTVSLWMQSGGLLSNLDSDTHYWPAWSGARLAPWIHLLRSIEGEFCMKNGLSYLTSLVAAFCDPCPHVLHNSYSCLRAICDLGDPFVRSKSPKPDLRRSPNLLSSPIEVFLTVKSYANSCQVSTEFRAFYQRAPQHISYVGLSSPAYSC